MSANDGPGITLEPAPSKRLGLRLGLMGGAFLVLVAGSSLSLARLGNPLTLTSLQVVAQTDYLNLPPKTLELRAKKTQAFLQSLQPSGMYIVVDTYLNQLRVMKDGKILREARCSTGTGIVLIDPRDKKRWVFDTPLGERVIERKQKNPVWIKPDWAFIEEGEEPPKDPAERVDPYSLGDYGLYMGDGYIIHGTLFKSLLGRRVTHGCIRLGDEDLAFLYHNVPVGTRVYLY